MAATSSGAGAILAAAPTTETAERPLWTRPYVLLCFTLLASCVHQGMLEPVIPLYVTDVGGSVVLAGFAIAAFSLASFGLRPLVGFAVDRLTPQLVLLVGTALLVLCGAAFMVPVLALLFVANAVRGLGWAGMNTGIDNVGLFYVVASVTGVTSRLFFGRHTDRAQRELWIGIGFALSVMGLLIIRSATGIELLMLGGMVYALGMAAASPMLLALAIDVGNPARPGAAMATFSAAFQIGPAIGAPTAGWLIESFGYQTMYGVAIGVAVIGLVLTLLRWRISADSRRFGDGGGPPHG